MMKGIITEVQGPVVDVLFPEGQLPFIKDALTVQNGEQKCVMEVAQHMGGNIVRCIMLSPSIATPFSFACMMQFAGAVFPLLPQVMSI